MLIEQTKCQMLGTSYGGGRNNAIDAAKLLAAFGVVMIHLAPSTPAAQLLSQIFLSFAVPFFLTIALYFFVNKACGMERLGFSELRMDRIFIPYAVWTVVYVVLRLIKYRVQHKLVHLDIVPALFYGGSGVQMYFLPLLLLFEALAMVVLLFCRKPPSLLVGIFLLVGAGFFGYIGSRENYFGFQKCLERGCIYVFFAFLLRYSQSNLFGRRVNMFSGGIVAALTVVATIVDYFPEWLAYIGGPLAGYSIAALALNLNFAVSEAPWRFFLSCSYGIYLAHPVFLEAIQFAASRLGYEMAPYSVVTKLLMSLVISLCCVSLIWLMRLNRLSAYCFLGEAADRLRG
jgi:peptidoglycan/LPS O-acetylase OafA/YrhL